MGPVIGVEPTCGSLQNCCFASQPHRRKLRRHESNVYEEVNSFPDYRYLTSQSNSTPCRLRSDLAGLKAQHSATKLTGHRAGPRGIEPRVSVLEADTAPCGRTYKSGSRKNRTFATGSSDLGTATMQPTRKSTRRESNSAIRRWQRRV